MVECKHRKYLDKCEECGSCILCEAASTKANKAKLIVKVRAILKGIDDTETCSDAGWWETSVGAEFGTNKLEDVINAIKEI